MELRKIGALRRAIRSAVSTLAKPATWMEEAFGATPASSGVRVNEETALQSTAVQASVRLIAETMASLPLIVYRRLPEGGKERATDHPLYPVLHDMANPEMTSMVFRETMQAHVLLWGNAFAEIEYNAAGDIVALWPLLPDRTYPVRDPATGELYYETSVPMTGQTIRLPAYKVLHIPGLGFNGLVGKSPIRMAREAVGLALATEKYGAKFFGQGAKPGGVLEHPGKLSEDAVKRLRNQWAEIHSGLENAHRVAILEEGMKYTQIGIPPEDAQFLQTRKFQVSEIARMFRVPPHMIGDLDRATFSNIEQQSLEFVVYTLRPWLVRWEQAIQAKLFIDAQERQTYFAEHLVDGLLRGDILSRYQAYAIGRQNGWLNADDIREMENRNPLPNGEGKLYLVNGNMVPLKTVAQQTGQAPAQPMPAAQPGTAVNSTRSARSWEERRRYYQSLARSYRHIFEDAAKRVLRREEADVMRQAKKMLGQRDVQQFRAWLEDFYRQHPEYVERTMAPIFQSYGQLVAELAAEDVGGQADAQQTQEFISRYVEVFIRRYIGESLGVLQKRIDEATAAQEELVKVLQDQFDRWASIRPATTAQRETVRTRNAVKRETWAANGVRALRWVTVGRNCPHCRHLDGKIVSISEHFVAEGEAVHPEGHDPLIPSSNIGHPPLHRSCNCDIEPVLD